MACFMLSQCPAQPSARACSSAFGPAAEVGSEAADTGSMRPTRERKKQGRPSIFFAPLRSAVFPGWGQLRNGKTLKAVLVFSVESYLVMSAVAEHYQAEEAYRRMELLNRSGQGEAAEELYRSYSDHFDRRDQLAWWTAGLIMLSMLDAYVDANFFGFDEEVRESSRVTFAPSRGGFAAAAGLVFKVEWRW